MNKIRIFSVLLLIPALPSFSIMSSNGSGGGKKYRLNRFFKKNKKDKKDKKKGFSFSIRKKKNKTDEQISTKSPIGNDKAGGGDNAEGRGIKDANKQKKPKKDTQANMEDGLNKISRKVIASVRSAASSSNTKPPAQGDINPKGDNVSRLDKMKKALFGKEKEKGKSGSHDQIRDQLESGNPKKKKGKKLLDRLIGKVIPEKKLGAIEKKWNEMNSQVKLVVMILTGILILVFVERLILLFRRIFSSSHKISGGREGKGRYLDTD